MGEVPGIFVIPQENKGRVVGALHIPLNESAIRFSLAVLGGLDDLSIGGAGWGFRLVPC